MAAPLETIGPYRILEPLGTGGMGEVHVAEQLEPIRRKVALKIVRSGLDSEQIVARFESERQAVALMDHPYIAKVYDAGTTPDGRPYFAMEYVKGEPITTYCDRARLTTHERLALTIQVCEAIQHAHTRAIIHRDLKPSNILVTTLDGEPVPKIIDFGVAKAMAQPLTDRPLTTEFGQILGTPEYMSPEQADTSIDRVDTRTDVYALGVVLYEMLTGVLPFESAELQASGVVETLRRICEVDPPRPSTRVSSLGDASTHTAEQRRTTVSRLSSGLRGDLDWITMRALDKDPARRYASPAELARDIQRHLDDEPVVAGPPSFRYRASKFIRRHRAGVAFGAVLLGFLAAFAITTTYQAFRIADERDRANLAAARAEREAATAQGVTRFLTQLFGEASPETARGTDPTATELIQRGVERIDQLADQPDVQAELRTTLGEVLLGLGKMQAAIPVIEPAVEYYERTQGDDSAKLARALHSLATVHGQLGRYAVAESTAQRAASLWNALQRPLMEAVSLNTVANATWGRGDLDGAAQLFRRVLDLQERELGPDAPQLTMAMTNLGSIHLTSGEPERARELYERILAIEEAQPDPEHDVGHGTTLHLLAMSHKELGDLDTALTYEQRSLAVRESTLGPDHWHVALSLTTLGEIDCARGQPAVAVPRLRRAVEIAESTWDAHPDLWWTQRSLARALLDAGEAQEAVDLATAQAAALREREALGPLALALAIRAAALDSLDSTQAAEAAYREATALMTEHFAPDDPDLQRTARAYAGVLRRNGKADDAAAAEAALGAPPVEASTPPGAKN